jgi:hypothetical protein
MNMENLTELAQIFTDNHAKYPDPKETPVNILHENVTILKQLRAYDVVMIPIEAGSYVLMRPAVANYIHPTNRVKH